MGNTDSRPASQPSKLAPLYGHEVMKACGWSPAMMTASKAAGYKFLYGAKTTILHYLQWRINNPDFKITNYIKAHSKNGTGARGLSQRSRGRKAGTVHKSDAS